MTSVLALLVGLYVAHTLGPTGFYDLCAAQQAECQSVVQTQSPTFDEVSRINRLVNRDIHPKPEPAGVDVWKVGPRDGDCDDYAMTKRHDLIKAGFGSARVRVAVGLAKGQFHAVLVVNLGARFYVLDNLTDEMLPVERSAVRIFSIQSPENPRVWLKAPGSDAPVGRPAVAEWSIIRPE